MALCNFLPDKLLQPVNLRQKTLLAALITFLQSLSEMVSKSSECMVVSPREEAMEMAFTSISLISSTDFSGIML